MSETIKAFLEEIKKNVELREKLSNAKEKEEVISIAKEYGFDLAEADFQLPEGELNEDALAEAAGGGACVCAFAGGGGGTDENDGKTYGCACALYGQGGDGNASDMNCLCAMVGEGFDDVQWSFDL